MATTVSIPQARVDLGYSQSESLVDQLRIAVNDLEAAIDRRDSYQAWAEAEAAQSLAATLMDVLDEIQADEEEVE